MAQHPYDQRSLQSPSYAMQDTSAYAPQITGYSQGNHQQYLPPAPQDWQRQHAQPVQQTSVPQPAAQVVVAPQFCAPVPTTFFMTDKLLNWSGDATILNESAGTPQNALTGFFYNTLQMMSMRKKWVICRGATADDKTVVAGVTKEMWSMRGGVQVKLAGSDSAQYTLRQQGMVSGRREVDIMHHNQVIGHVSRARSGQAIWLDKQSYQITLNPGYDHVFLLCVVVIMGVYFHQDRGTGGILGMEAGSAAASGY